MPTIEIISLDAVSIALREEDFTMTIIEEPRLVSHRVLFDDALRQRKGVIVHLGNPCFRNDKSCFFAGELIAWDDQAGKVSPSPAGNGKGYECAGQVNSFCFLPQFKDEVVTIVRKAISASPVNAALFLTDIQSGPDKGSFAEPMTRQDFWKCHDAMGLLFNTLYTITQE